MGCVMFVLWHTLLFFLLKKLLYTKLDRCRFEEVGHWVSDIGLLDSGHPKPGVLGLKNQDAFKKCIVFEEKKANALLFRDNCLFLRCASEHGDAVHILISVL